MKIFGIILALFGAAQYGDCQEVIYELTNEHPTSSAISNEFSKLRATGDVIWIDDFSIPANWNATGPSTDSVQNGWSIGLAVHGWYFSGFGGDMGTSGNFARFVNGDPTVPNVVEDGPFTLEYNNPIDLSGIVSPIFEFEQYGARFVTYQGVEVSTDGGATWTEVLNNNSYPPFANNSGGLFPKPEMRSANIAAQIAANPSNVTIRFIWDGMINGSMMNYIEYGWFIDNARIVEGANYDAEIQKKYFRSGVGGFFPDGLEYYSIPQSQLTDIEFSATVFNNGGQTHTGLKLETNVDNGGLVFSNVSTLINLPPQNTDSLVASTSFVPPTTQGPYQILWNFSGINLEEITTNDTLIDTLEVTAWTYSRANSINQGYIDDVMPNDSIFQIGNVMEIFSFGIINNMQVQISDNVANEGELVYGTIYKYNTGIGQYELVTQTSDVEITNTSNGTMLNLPLIQPLEVQMGEVLLVCAGHYGGGGNVDFMMAQYTNDQSVMGWVPQYNFFTLFNAKAIQVQLEIANHYITQQTAAICIGDSLVLGSSTYYSAGVYSDTLTAVNNGLDSVLVVNLIVDSPYEGGQSVIICEGESYLIGNSSYTTAGSYTDTLVMSLGTCDSIIHTMLSTVPAPVPIITLFQDTITAIDINSSVQWVNCDSAYAEIPGAISHVFTSVIPGNYAAVMTLGGCVDTSICAPLGVIEIQENIDSKFKIYPNPASQSLTIESSMGNLNGYTLEILNSLGQIVVARFEMNSEAIELSITHLNAGIYYLRLGNGLNSEVFKLIVN